MKTKQLHVNVKAGDDDLAEGEFIAYPSTFTRTPDSYGDVVAPGAFADSIKEWKDSGNTLPVMYGHRMDDPDYNIGGVSDMGEDDHGWWIRGRIDLDTPKGSQVYRLLKNKRLSQLSFAFDVLDEGTVELDDGTKANELRKLKVYEASFVPVGANQDTSVVAIKSAASLLLDGMKEGRALSTRNVNTLTEIADQLTESAKTIRTLLESAQPKPNPAETNEEKRPDGDAKNEEPPQAKSEEPNRTAEALSLAIQLALTGQKGE